MNVRIVVADERQANFYDASKPDGPLSERGELQNETSGLKDRDLETDRPGRRFGGTGHHHDVAGERSTARHELEQFARRVAQRIDHDRIAKEFDKLVIVAPPKVLGLLRQSLPAPLQNVIAAEIPKDLLHSGADAIREAVPREAFSQLK
jgi:protein required for attachment to host cells